MIFRVFILLLLIVATLALVFWPFLIPVQTSEAAYQNRHLEVIRGPQP